MPDGADPSLVDEHFESPRNAGVLADADLRVEVENPVCGDVLRLFVRRRAHRSAGDTELESRIEAVRFQVLGCPPAVAAGSILTGLLEGAARRELGRLDVETIDRALGGLPDRSRHVAYLARDAVQALLKIW